MRFLQEREAYHYLVNSSNSKIVIYSIRETDRKPVDDVDKSSTTIVKEDIVNSNFHESRKNNFIHLKKAISRMKENANSTEASSKQLEKQADLISNAVNATSKLVDTVVKSTDSQHKTVINANFSMELQKKLNGSVIVPTKNIKMNESSITDQHESSISKLGSNERLLFFTPDYHNGTQVDLVSSIVHFHHSIYMSSPVCNLPTFYVPPVPVVRSGNFSMSYSQVILASKTQCTNTPTLYYWENNVKQLMSLFRNDKIFERVDAIICMFTPTLCEAFIPFNKTMIFLVAHRFFLRRCSKDENTKYINWVTHGNGELRKNAYRADIRLMAAGQYDAEYINYYTGLNVPIIYSQHFIDNVMPVTDYPRSEDFVIAPFRYRYVSYGNEMKSACKTNNVTCSFMTVKSKFGDNFDVSNLTYFKAAIIFPYAVLSYYINDLIATGIPLFVPSPSFLIQLKVMITYRTSQDYYCSKLTEPPRSNQSRHSLSPESNSTESQLYWFKFASFYTPNTIQFNNWTDLSLKIKNTNYGEVFKKNLKYIEEMKVHNVKEWTKLFKSIKRNRSMPLSYSDAINRFDVRNFV